jgi:hypothetical protein
MKTEFIFRKTKDLSVHKKDQIRNLLLRVFKIKLSAELFEQRFLYSSKGYSYHGLMVYKKEIVGTFNAIPYRYRCFSKEQTFALSVDTMIAPEHRGATNLQEMASMVYHALIDDGIPFIYGFPNELYYNHEKRILKTKDIGKLDYYVLPLNIGAVFLKMRLLNPLSQICAKMIVRFPKVHRSAEHKYNIEKIDDKQFRKHRYDDSYSIVGLDSGGECVYKIYEEERKVRVLYIIDVTPLASVYFDEAVRRVYKLASRSVDLVIYVGKLPFRPARLIKLPKLMEPQKVRMTGKILVPGVVNDSVFAIENWNVNISDFDVR